MNLAHIVGGHTSNGQWQQLIHIATSWLPVIIAVAMGLAAILWTAARLKPKAQKQEIDTKK